MDDSGVHGGLVALRDSLRNQLWPLPTLGVLLALGLGYWLPVLDEHLEDDLPPSVQEILFGGGAGAASTVLDAIAGSTVTVTSLTFSLTVVTLQLASSQFSPRLLRTFTSDLFVQVTLALFLATFIFSLTVLRSVRTEDASQAEFVPHLSVTIAFVLAVASVLGLVLFLAHLAQVIRVETILRTVHLGASQTLRRVLDPRPDTSRTASPPVPPADAVLLRAPRSGFVVQVDRKDLLAAAVEMDAVLLLDRSPGDSIVEGTPIGAAWSRSGALDEPQREHLQACLAAAVQTGRERTAAEDIGYGLRQLTDVAVKALSPGINDPTTAVHALGHSSALLCEFSGRDLGPEQVTDESEKVRLVLARPDLADLLELAIAQPRRYGAADPDVLARIAGLLAELAWCIELPAHRNAVIAQLGRLQATVAAANFDGTERATLADLGDATERALRREWAPRKRAT